MKHKNIKNLPLILLISFIFLSFSLNISAEVLFGEAYQQTLHKHLIQAEESITIVMYFIILEPEGKGPINELVNDLIGAKNRGFGILGNWKTGGLGIGDWAIGRLGRKYLKMGEVDLEEGKRVIIVHSPQSIVDSKKAGKLKLVLIDKKEREKAEKIIWKRINSPETEVCYIFEK